MHSSGQLVDEIAGPTWWSFEPPSPYTGRWVVVGGRSFYPSCPILRWVSRWATRIFACERMSTGDVSVEKINHLIAFWGSSGPCSISSGAFKGVNVAFKKIVLARTGVLCLFQHMRGLLFSSFWDSVPVSYILKILSPMEWNWQRWYKFIISDPIVLHKEWVEYRTHRLMLVFPSFPQTKHIYAFFSFL